MLHKKNRSFWNVSLLILVIYPAFVPVPQPIHETCFPCNIPSPTLTSLFVPDDVKDSTLIPNGFSLAETHVPAPETGTMNPVIVEQSGYSESDYIPARTDTRMNTEYTMIIDTVHNWTASRAEVGILDLKKIYAENGTFDEGYPGTNLNPIGDVTYYPLGWDATSETGDTAQVQLASYFVGTESYVIVENQGAPVGPAIDRDYQHSSGTNITWTQTASNSPYNEDFILRFRYLYFRGPLGAVPANSCFIVVCINDAPIWNISLPLVEQRGIWFDSGDIPISLEGIGSTFKIDIGLAINQTIVLDPNTDYDSDGTIDGIQNAYFITAFLDDFSFVSASPPSCDEVNLEFSINSASADIIGSGGTGFGYMQNETYWTMSPLGYSITSNTSVSFTYVARLLNHRFLNSSWTTDTQKQGVAYTIGSAKHGNLELYTYLGFLEDYKGLALKIHHPHDWENFTVFDPFLSDVTSTCICNEDSIVIPETLSNRLGWWKLTVDSPNYASSVMLERYESSISSWVEETIFHSFDLARMNVSIGTANETPVLSNPVNFAWVFPNCTIWEETSSIGGVGTAISPQVEFEPTNITAGLWGAKILWTNGSELAFDCLIFELHHKAVLELVFSDSLETVVGQPVTVVLRFRDTENGQLILNDDALIVGQWIGTDVEFSVDIVNNWWQAEFNTALFGSGSFTINITSFTPCFEADSLEVSIYSYYLTTLYAPLGPMTPLVYGRQYSFEYTYSLSHNNTGIDNATVEVFEGESLGTSVKKTGNGHYNLSLLPTTSNDYSIRIRFSKEGYENQTHVLTFLVNDVEIEVGSISSLVGTELFPLRIEVEIVESDTRNLVVDANVTLAIYRPGDYLYLDALMNEEISGVYSTYILMPSADSGTYTVRISAEKDNHKMVQEFSAALVPLYDFNQRLVYTILEHSWQIGTIAVVAVVAVLGQRVRMNRRREKHASAMAFKVRLNDANNILGAIVLHKLSGVPVYSKVFKEGFEEGLLSAFISAIMHFREAIDAGKAENYTLIPISEVMRAVPSENLICAFITMTTPSVEQEMKMVGFARAIGMMFDDVLAAASAQVVDEETRRTFEVLFDNLMDGHLIRRYRLADRELPKSLKLIERALQLEEGEETFILSALVSLMLSIDISVDDVYVDVLGAIEKEYILPVYQYILDDEHVEL